ncbi:type I-E CRISPR-associated protein Cas5/CasD [Rhodoblastus sphagnicola]|uniref:Type I-E CRISPR-associated protein Cas5/CasD n=1 Tax=Rhodoblastus sphagnicola TaxID=333368 RepID=A0A2S6NFZ4_9HYPH|nr:type I-E CRISPR-associated protein Cas5/CasD [Rhodoblastus sphagnicola]MBB4199536.1 CRISPR system Cascade subunit CasD [Rhodoblastus sphagnicola]PPQ33510.1 type I-E CRISPR-associated protein Cas5/CasD [Rhodoblastus sphagnicola]
MATHLILTLEGPLAAYGAEMVDARGPVRDWPGASLLTGLIANALGFTRAMGAELAALQARLDFAVRIDRPGVRLRDFQTAQLSRADAGWTTRGAPEGRAGGDGTYHSPHIRERDYFADSAVTVALALRQPETAPTLETIGAALETPARPLFLGRKPCLPSRPLFSGFVEAEDALAAVRAAPALDDAESDPWIVIRRQPGETETPLGFEPLHVTDQRNWIASVHAGERVFLRARASRFNALGEGPTT